MANAILAHQVNRESITQAINEARQQCQTHRRWLNALNKAADYLEAAPIGAWQFDGETLRIASRTTTGQRYTVTARGCECKAAEDGIPCWHRAAHRLLCKAAEGVRIPAPVSTGGASPSRTLLEIERDIAELFA